MTSVFVAGSRKIGRLNDQIRRRLNNLIVQNYRILVGDANGVDRAVQAFLRDHAYRDVVVYCSGKVCRNNVGDWTSFNVQVDTNLKGREFYAHKDKKMAEDADYGLMIWDGKSSGTICNVLELLKRNKKSLVYFSPDHSFIPISTLNEVEQLIRKCSPEDIAEISKKIKLKTQLSQVATSAQGALEI